MWQHRTSIFFHIHMYSKLVLLLAEKRHQPCAITKGWLQCLLSLSPLLSSILGICGTQPNQNCITSSTSCILDLAVGESSVTVLLVPFPTILLTFYTYVCNHIGYPILFSTVATCCSRNDHPAVTLYTNVSIL